MQNVYLIFVQKTLCQKPLFFQPFELKKSLFIGKIYKKIKKFPKLKLDTPGPADSDMRGRGHRVLQVRVASAEGTSHGRLLAGNTQHNPTAVAVVPHGRVEGIRC